MNQSINEEEEDFYDKEIIESMGERAKRILIDWTDFLAGV